jgi:hypothetical protein
MSCIALHDVTGKAMERSDKRTPCIWAAAKCDEQAAASSWREKSMLNMEHDN